MSSCARMARRGLRGVKLLISDDHKGLKAAATRILGATWRKDAASHFARNLLAHAEPPGPAASSPPIGSPPPSPRRTPTARRPSGVRSTDQHQAARCPSWQFSWHEAEHDVLAYMTFPKEHRQKLHSTNPIERLHAEVKRRTNVVGIFPNEAAITRLVGAILSRAER